MSRPPDESVNWKTNFFIHVVGTQKNRLNETFLLNTQNTIVLSHHFQLQPFCQFWCLTVTDCFHVQIQRGIDGPDPPGKSQVIWVYIEISIWTLLPGKSPPPPLENVGTPLDPLNSNSFLCYKTIGPPL